MKKYLAEMVGTMVLVLMGCGSAIFNGGCGSPAQVLMVAMAFGCGNGLYNWRHIGLPHQPGNHVGVYVVRTYEKQ